jgi:hypothetical protein
VQRWQSNKAAAFQFGAVYGRMPHTPEKRLLVAILLDALSQFERVRDARRPRDAQTRAELRAWFFADDANWPFSFENVCAHLGLEPAAIRDQLGRNTLAADARSRRARRSR